MPTVRSIDGIEYHEGVSEAWMPNIVSDSSDIERDEILVGQTGDERIARMLISFPCTAVLKEDSDWGDKTRAEKEEIDGLEYIESVLEIMV